jgi:hypothetical protein
MSSRLTFLLLVSVAGCGGGQAGGGGYLLDLKLQGSPQAFSNRQISVDDAIVGPPRPVDPVTGWQTAFASLCTLSKDQFLNHPVHVVVTSTTDGAVVSTTDVARFVCKFSTSDFPNAHWEQDTWFVDDDGTIEANTTDLTKTGSACGDGSAGPGGYVCPHADF